MSKKADKKSKKEKSEKKEKKGKKVAQTAELTKVVAESTAMPVAKGAAEKAYLTPAEWGQIMATAWANADFKEALERDPIPAIREWFPTFAFTRVLMIAPPPPGITHEQLERTAYGEEIVIPDVAVGPHIYFHG
jgi:hypothetical protein